MQAGNDANAFLIDTNQFQGTEDWAQIATAKIHGILPVKGALIRASQGLSQDTALVSAAHGATTQGLWRGFYHTIIPQGGTYTAAAASAQAQAAYFLHVTQAVQGWTGRCLNPGVDIEVNPFGLSSSLYVYWLERFLMALETGLSAFPLKPMLYLSPSKWQALLGSTTTFQSYLLWAADWGVSEPPDFGGWTEWVCWQWSAPGRLAGVPGNTDYDEWHTPELPGEIVAPATTSPVTTLNQVASQLDALHGTVSTLATAVASLQQAQKAAGKALSS